MKENKFAILLRSRKYQEAVAQRCSVKKVFLEISEKSQEDTCARATCLIKLQGWALQLY